MKKKFIVCSRDGLEQDMHHNDVENLQVLDYDVEGESAREVAGRLKGTFPGFENLIVIEMGKDWAEV